MMFDVLTVNEFLDARMREDLLAHLRDSATQPATVYGTGSGAAVHPRVRSVRQIEVAAEWRDRVVRLLRERAPELELHFDVALGECEEPQFLRYEAGDFFVAHQDGNTALLAGDSQHRRISVVIFLNDDYEGGALTFHGAYPDYEIRQAVPAERGSLVVFRSETTHEVTPVTHGERFTIVSWYRAR